MGSRAGTKSLLLTCEAKKKGMGVERWQGVDSKLYFEREIHA